jgi:branched-chain amino acid transport system ATP-binding protein
VGEREAGPAAVAVEGVTVDFGGFCALERVDLAVAAGERRAIIGPNGAGKTTLLRVIGGAQRPTAGVVRLHGRDITHTPEHVRPRLGIGRTYQIATLFQHLSVLDNMHLAVHGTSRRKWSLVRAPGAFAEPARRAREWLQAVGLAHRAADGVAALSHGEQRQLEIALALAGQPRVLLLDEPAAGLAPAERQLIAAVIRRLPRDITVVMIEHDVQLTLALVDRITVLHHGQVVADGTAEEVQRNPEVRKVYLGGG